MGQWDVLSSLEALHPFHFGRAKTAEARGKARLLSNVRASKVERVQGFAREVLGLLSSRCCRHCAGVDASRESDSCALAVLTPGATKRELFSKKARWPIY